MKGSFSITVSGSKSIRRLNVLRRDGIDDIVPYASPHLVVLVEDRVIRLARMDAVETVVEATDIGYAAGRPIPPLYHIVSNYSN